MSAVHAMWEKLKLSCDGSDSGSKKADEAMVGSGGFCVCWESGVRQSVFVFVVLVGI
jgi:hypothetical protein